MAAAVYRPLIAAIAALTWFVCPATALPASGDEARQHAEKGVQCARAGDLVCAEAELRQAVTLAPNDAAYLTSLGGILGMEHKLDAANVFFEKAVSIDPENTAARRNLAANEWRLGRLAPAQANLERLLRSQPEDKTSTLLLGMVSENEHDYPRAAKLLSSVPELVAQRPESMAALANAYYHTGRREQAHRILERLIGSAAPPQGIFSAAGVAAQSEDYELAEKLFQCIRSTYPDARSIGYNIALIQFRTQRIPESEKTLTDLIDAGHSSAEVYDLLGRCYQKQGKTVEAAHTFETGMRTYPEGESNYGDLVGALRESNRLSAALQLASKYTELFPRSESAFVARASLEMQTYAFTDAVRSYSHALALDPRSLDAKLGLASAKWAAGMRAEAQTQFQTLQKQYPRDARVYESYGSALASDADDQATLERASGLLGKAIELDGSRAETHYQLGQLDLKNNSSQRALEQFEIAAQLGLNDSRVHYALARAYRRLGREEDASKQMRLYTETKAKESERAPVQTAAAQSK